MLLALAGAGAARAEGFMRPIVGIADPSTEGYASAAIGGLCAGYRWRGENASVAKEASLEIGYTKWTHRASTMGYEMRAKEEYLTVLLNLRAHFPLGESPERVNFYFGPAVGLAQARGSLRIDVGARTERFSASD